MISYVVVGRVMRMVVLGVSRVMIGGGLVVRSIGSCMMMRHVIRLASLQAGGLLLHHHVMVGRHHLLHHHVLHRHRIGHGGSHGCWGRGRSDDRGNIGSRCRGGDVIGMVAHIFNEGVVGKVEGVVLTAAVSLGDRDGHD